jgi:hypothetical protein
VRQPVLCRFHHRHHAQHGWQVTITNGVPEWTPPAWLDPHRRPIRNTTHHLDDLTFTTDHAA